MWVVRFLQIFVAVIFAAASVEASAPYFFVSDQSKRCFIQEVPEDIPVQGIYKNMDFDKFPRMNGIPLSWIEISVVDPEDTVMLTKRAIEEGRFAFTSAKSGEYKICLQVAHSEDAEQVSTRHEYRFSWSFDVSDQATDYATLAKSEHLSSIDVELRKINDRLKAVQAEQQYQRKLEAKFRDINESANAHVVWLTIVQVLILILSSVYQVWSANAFFKTKKKE